MRNYRNTGRVVDKSTRAPVASLRVEAWDTEHLVGDLVGYAVTDADGRFSMSLTADDVAALFPDHRARVYFRVLSGTNLLADTEDRITWSIKGPDGDEVILVDASAPAAVGQDLAPFVVRGHLFDAVAGPLPGRTIKVFDRDLRSETLLGETTTDAHGAYFLAYAFPALGASRSPKIWPDLLVRALDGRDVLAEATMRCHAPPTVVIDLVANGTTYRGPTEYASVSERVSGALGRVDPATLTADEIARLACSTDLDIALVTAYADAARLHSAMGLDNAQAVFYGLVRQGLSSNRRALLSVPPAQLRQALVASGAANIIPRLSSEMLEAIIEGLRGAAVDLAFETPDPSTTASIGHVIGLALSGESDPTAAARTFVDRYTAHAGTIQEFWAALESDFSSAAIGRLQLALQWGALTRYHKPLMDELEVRRAAGTLTTLKDLARLDEGDWLDLIDHDPGSGPIGHPADVPEIPDQRTNYAKILTDTMEAAFPTVAIHDRVFRTEGDGTDLWKFLNNNSGFEFGKTRVNLFLAGSPSLTGVADAAALKARLLKMERVFKVAPKYSEMKKLIDDGRDSAHAIERMGKERFTEEYMPLFGACRTEATYERACYVAAASTYLMYKYGANLNQLTAKVLPNKVTKVESTASEVADWEELFGSLNFCACERCRSVHGPAAYLVDLLQFLDKQKSTVLGKTAKDILLSTTGLVRRADIAHIELTCDNTNIALPQVDLNIELMERRIAGTPPPTVIKSTGRTEDLLALPEITDPGAKAGAAGILADAIYPWILPVDLPREEARVYLDHMQVPRWQLMELLQSTAEGPSDDEIAQEHLGMSTGERDLVLGAHGGTTQSFWGMTGVSDWETKLQRVDKFLRQSGLAYDDLLELVDSAFLHTFGDPALTPDEGSDGCDLSKLSITGLSSLATAWAAVHRFLRLRRRLGWSITEVDQAVEAFGGNLDDGLLLSLSELVRLREEVNPPLSEMLAWWATIDARVRTETKVTSPYARLFLNRAVENLPDEDFDPEPSGGGALAGHKTAILAALRMSEADFQLLTVEEEAALVVTLPLPLANDAFNGANLSKLYRIASLARSLKLPIRDLLVLRALAGEEPLDALLPAGSGPAGPRAARAFVERVQKLRGAGWRVAELHYLVRHVTQPTDGVSAEDAIRTRRRVELEAELDKIVAATTLVSDPTGVALTDLSTALLTVAMRPAPPDDVRRAVEDLLALIKGESIGAADRRARLVDILTPFLEPEDDPDDVADQIVGPAPSGPPEITDERDRFDHVQVRLLDYVRRRDSDAVIKQKVSDWFKLDGPTVNGLLQALTMPGPVEFNAALRPPRNSASEVAGARDKALIRITKAATVVSRLELTADEVDWILQHASEGWLDVNALPLEQDAAAATGADLPGARALLTGLERLIDTVELRGRIKAGPTALIDLFRFTPGMELPAAEEQFHTELSKQTGWRFEDIQALASRFGLTYPDDYRSEMGLRRLADVFDAQKRLGATPAPTLEAWAESEVSVDVAIDVRLVAKAKHSPADWLTVARPLRDVLREKQRSTLVAYLVNAMGLERPDDLLGILLVDVEITCCQLTSRIKHAIGSVQLFIQRALLNLVDTVKLSEEAAREWFWMKSFVVWEAARKVFLHPETWIVAELRDDKTPFFRELESKLAQNDITDENAEEAYLGYLEKLDAVARLDVVGMCHHAEDAVSGADAIDVLHVFGRTEGSPHKYFHRTRVDSSRWTPWVKIDFEIPGDHILPVVFDRRLHLYWPVFEDKPDKDQNGPSEDTPLPPRVHLETQISATELKGERWLPPAPRQESRPTTRSRPATTPSSVSG